MICLVVFLEAANMRLCEGLNIIIHEEIISTHRYEFETKVQQ